MHYEQLRSTVAPVVAAVRTELAGGGTRPSASRLAAAEAALQQFDLTEAGLKVPAPLAAVLASVVSADKALMADLRTLSSGSAPAGSEVNSIRDHLGAWDKAMAAAGRSLSA